jgi:hypothetical protein
MDALAACRILNLPAWAAHFLYLSGDFARALGWRTPVTSTARREMARGAIGDPARWRDVTGIAPRELDEMLGREPASVQERWFARLYILKPLVFGVFGISGLRPGLSRWDPDTNTEWRCCSKAVSPNVSAS